MTTVSFDELHAAYLFASAGGGMECSAFIQQGSGKIYYQSIENLPEEETPDDINDATRYVELPQQNDLDLGRELVFAFVETHLPAEIDKVSAMFHQRGAYRHFKDWLAQRDALDAWYTFEQQATERALRAWCAENEIELTPPATPVSSTSNS